jgi:hypothetical protein
MADDKASFLLYSDLIHTVGRLTEEQAGRLFKHILAYVNDQDPELEDQVLQVAFEPIKQSLKRDLKKWEQTRKKRSESGRKGGLAKAKNQQKKAKLANARNGKQTLANQAVNVSVSVNGINNRDYLNIIKRKKHAEYGAWLGGICNKHKIRGSRIWRIMEKFCDHLKANEKVHDDIASFKKHFINWLDMQDHKGMLGEYKTRREGAL